ncbi:WUSCHEL-related homeobox 8 [Linum perenne]
MRESREQQLERSAQLRNGEEEEEEVTIYNNGGLIGNGLVGGGGVKVMTDEQMEMLRKQISVYTTICDSLVQMHTSFALNRHDLSGMLAYGDHCGPSKIPSRQRWAPKQAQLQILERIFSECNANPGKDKIKEITAELSKYGQVKETSVYNWFQNRRARCKRKQSAPAPRTANFDVEASNPEYAAAKQKIPEDDDGNQNSPLIVDQLYFHSPEIGIDQLIGKFEACEGYNLYWQEQQNGLS